MEPAVTTYLVYVLVSVALTVWVARTLFKNGRAFLVDVFGENTDLADSVNHLLVVGFYLVNLGYISLTLKLRGTIPGTREAIEALSGKIGMVLVALGIMHFANLYVFSQLRRRGSSRAPRRPEVPSPTCASEGR